MGALLLLLGIYFFLQIVMENHQLADMLTASFAVIFIGGWYLAQYFIRSFKERVTFPRTGYVAYRQSQSFTLSRSLAAIVVAILAAGLLAFSQIRTPEGLNLLPAFSGILIAIVLGLMGFQAKLPRFYGLATISLVLGAIFTPIQLSNDLASSAYCAAMGVVLLISGGAILSRYLRQNPAQLEASDDK
jgi:hypothetical protein